MKKVITVICILSTLTMVVWKLTEPTRRERKRLADAMTTSDSRKFDETVTIQGDDWVGYLVFKSKEFREQLAAKNIGVRYELVPNFSDRVSNLGNGTAQMAAMTIDSWLTNGAKEDYPGVIGFVIDESTGGDVILGGPKVKSINDLKQSGLTGVYVANSPSEFLLKSAIRQFRLTPLKDSLPKWGRKTITECQSEFAAGKADFAVLWEPMATATLTSVKGSTRLLDTAQTKGSIVDVCIFSRRFLQERPKTAALVTEAYFRALHHLLINPDEMQQLAADYSQSDLTAAAKVLTGVTFTPYEANQKEWFGSTTATSGKLFDTIEYIGQTLVTVGDFKENPVAGNPYAFTNRRLVGDLVNAKLPALPASLRPAPPAFPPLSEAEWIRRSAQIVGHLIDEPILFNRGTAEISEESETLLTEAVANLVRYPTYRVRIDAGVAPGGNPEDDSALSIARADALRNWILVKSGEPEARFKATGLGSAQAPARRYGENLNAWEARCRFAKIYLVKP